MTNIEIALLVLAALVFVSGIFVLALCKTAKKSDDDIAQLERRLYQKALERENKPNDKKKRS